MQDGTQASRTDREALAHPKAFGLLISAFGFEFSTRATNTRGFCVEFHIANKIDGSAGEKQTRELWNCCVIATVTNRMWVGRTCTPGSVDNQTMRAALSRAFHRGGIVHRAWHALMGRVPVACCAMWRRCWVGRWLGASNLPLNACPLPQVQDRRRGVDLV
jgi:hypothetical protein